MSSKVPFGERVDDLIDMVDHGQKLRGEVEYNQPYAQIQHEDMSFRHPRGGQAKYLESPLLGRADQYFRQVSSSVLEDGGRQGMIRAVESLCDDSSHLAPIEFGDLRNSDHPTVTVGPETVYDRPPEQDRLTEAQMAAKDRVREGRR